MRTTLVASFIFLSFMSGPSFPRDYYVATAGNDENPGTLDKPFATLERARDAIRQFRTTDQIPVEGVTIYLRAGKYFRTSSFNLTTQDSGEQDKPVTYRAYPGEQIRIIGGRQLSPSWFSLVASADSVWGRLDPSAQGKCLKVHLPSHGLKDFAKPLQMELSFNGRLMQLARWPNEGFVKTTSAENDITFGYDDPRPQRWLTAADAFAMGYWRHGWSSSICPIAKIDPAAKKITLSTSPNYGLIPKTPYYILNLLEEIDVPAEWYFDAATGTLYFWPPDDLKDAEILISTLSQPLINLSDASNIRFVNLTIEMTAGAAIRVSCGNNNIVSHCTIRNIRSGAVAISGQDSGVEHCTLSAVGAAAVSLSGGDRNKLLPCNNFVRNCRIDNFGRWQRTYAPGIRLEGVGCIAANNLLYNAPHSAIMFGGNEHLIELNQIHNVCYEVDDAGAIYAGRDWGLRGNIIRCNFFHDIQSLLPGSNGVHAVYLDDCASGIAVFGNVFYKISGRAIMCGGGRDNTIDNNVIAKCGSAHFTDRRGKVWIDKDASWRLLDKIKRLNYTEPPWSTKYPLLAKILDNGYEQAKEPEGCLIIRNIGWQNKRWLEKNCLGACGGFDFYTIKDNIEDRDPRFVDEGNLNLALRDDSPAYSIPGFQRIPFDQIGPQPAQYRAGSVSDRPLEQSPERKRPAIE